MPRYTSYPTAPHFKALTSDEAYVNAIETLPDDAPISLYLHIPFCPKMCWYCGCNTKVTRRYAPVEDYVHLLLREVDLVAEKTGRKSVSHIHFGGGSPSYLRGEDFDLLMEKLRARFNILGDAEIAIEIDPRNVSEERVASYARQGVNRVSLGVQDFDDKVLAAVNRQQPFELSYEAVRLLRRYGIDDINLDLIYGLPHQSCDTMKKAIALALTLKPKRFAVFGYAHVPWMKKHMRLIEEGTLPDKDLRYDLFQTACDELAAAGYQMIGIDHFALPDDTLAMAADQGTMRRNFQGYTVDSTQTMIGLGVSSIGQIDGRMYTQNACDMPAYKAAILDGRLPVQKQCPITAEDRLRADVIERLMCDFTVDLAQHCAAHGFPANHLDAEAARLQPYEAMTFVTRTGSRVTVSPDARLMVRSICAVFDTYLAASTSQAPKHAQAV